MQLVLLKQKKWLIIAFLIWAAVIGLYINNINDNDPVLTGKSSEKGACGANALADACSVLDVNVDYEVIYNKLKLDKLPSTSFGHIKTVAEKFGLKASLTTLTKDGLLGLRSPVIAFVRGGHFLTIATQNPESKELFVLDRPNHPEWIHIDEFAKNWNGESLVLSHKSKRRNKNKLWSQGEKTSLGNLAGTKNDYAQFTLINQGNKPIKILSEKYTCECVKNTTYSKKIIPPQSSSIVKLDIDNLKRNRGSFNLGMIITTDNDYEPIKKIDLTGIIRTPFKATPAFFSFGDILPNETNRKIKSKIFFDTISDEIVIKSEYLDEGLTLDSVKKIEKDLFEVEMQVDFSKIKLIDDNRFYLVAVLDTGICKDRKVLLEILGRKVNKFSVIPSSLYLGTFNSGDIIRKRLKVSWADLNKTSSLPSKIISEYIKGVDIKVDSESTINTNFDGQWIDVEISSQEKGFYRSSISIECSGKSIKVPVIGYIKDN